MTLIDVLTVLLIAVYFVVAIFLIIVLYRANHVMSKWTRVSDTFSDSLSKIIPAFLNVVTITEGIKKVLEILAEHKKKKEKF